jgi:hypothetical protein
MLIYYMNECRSQCCFNGSISPSFFLVSVLFEFEFESHTSVQTPVLIYLCGGPMPQHLIFYICDGDDLFSNKEVEAGAVALCLFLLLLAKQRKERGQKN